LSSQIRWPRTHHPLSTKLNPAAIPSQFWKPVFDECSSEELLKNHPTKFLNGVTSKVEVPSGRIETGNLRVIKTYRQYIFTVLAEGPSLRLFQLMPRPDLLRVGLRDEDDAVASLVAIDALQVLVEILAPEACCFVRVIEDPDIVTDKKTGEFLDNISILPREGKSDIKLEIIRSHQLHSPRKTVSV